MFCQDLPELDKEVPCSITNDYGQLIDLSPLTKTTGGYLVDDSYDRKIYINVCKGIVQGNLSVCHYETEVSEPSYSGVPNKHTIPVCLFIVDKSAGGYCLLTYLIIF